MGARKPEDTRTIAIAAHGGAGKTSLVEAMLYDVNVISRMGRIEEGNTVSDFDPEEQKRQISINTSIVTFDYKDKTFFILDTPGYADFVGDLRSGMRVADSAVILISGVDGVEVQTEKAFDFADDFSIPVVFFVNKLDRDNSDYNAILKEIRQVLTDRAISLYLPIGKESNFKGVVNVLTGRHISTKGTEARITRKHLFLPS
jgi:elongation factor G